MYAQHSTDCNTLPLHNSHFGRSEGSEKGRLVVFKEICGLEKSREWVDRLSWWHQSDEETDEDVEIIFTRWCDKAQAASHWLSISDVWRWDVEEYSWIDKSTLLTFASLFIDRVYHTPQGNWSSEEASATWECPRATHVWLHTQECRIVCGLHTKKLKSYPSALIFRISWICISWLHGKIIQYIFQYNV